MDNITQLSPQQQAVLDWSTNSKGSLILQARAGTGKSSTLIKLVEHIIRENPTKCIFVGAYNRPIADEFIARLRAANIAWNNATANTWHGAGLSAWCKVTGWSIDERERHVDDKKLAKIVDAFCQTPAQQERIEGYRDTIIQAVGLAKQRAFGVLCHIDDQSKWFELVDHFGLDENLPEEADMDYFVKGCIWLYKASLLRCKETIDFDDMILAPLYFKARVWPYDYVMIDEAQDTNAARRCLALKMLKPTTGRLVAVGDPAQAIYGFTGADADSLELIRSAVNAQTLPLTVSYRCPKVGVARAQQWVPDIQAHESAIDGMQRSIFAMPNPDPTGPKRCCLDDENFTPEDAILCRNTKPLVTTAYSLLRRGVPCKVEGREIASGLIHLINRWKVVNTPALINAITEWRDKEVQKYLAKEQESKAEEISDRAETIIVLAQQLMGEGKTKVAELVAFIDGMFGNTKPGDKPYCLTLATVHKSKGREWKRVYILGQQKFMPSKWARKEWQMVQEQNLLYVAATRAQEEIVDVVVD